MGVRTLDGEGGVNPGDLIRTKGGFATISLFTLELKRIGMMYPGELGIFLGRVEVVDSSPWKRLEILVQGMVCYAWSVDVEVVK